MKRAFLLTLVVSACLQAAVAAEPAATGSASGEPAAGPPLPLHAFEGVSGSFIVHSAYLANPPAAGEVIGLPSLGGIHVHAGHGRALYAFTLTENLWGRVEFGYGFNHFDAGDLPQDIQNTTGVRIRDDCVDLQNFNLRCLLVQEGAFGKSWLPALTVGAHFKHNETIDRLDRDLAGALGAIGIEDNQGWDFTLYASKMITALPRPVIVSAGIRSTEAAHTGLLGFTDERELVGEGSICVLATDRLILAGEYRQKPNEYDRIPGLVEREDDWWTLCAGYIVNEHMTLAGGYANFGHLLNHEARGAWGLALKWEM